MKRIVIAIAAVLCLTACTEDLSEYFDRVDAVEAANEQIKNANAEQARNNAEQADRNAEQEAWNAEQERRNQEQEQENAKQEQQNSDLSSQADDQSQRNDEQRERNEQLRLMWEELQHKIDSLEALLNAPKEVEPKLLSMEFRPSENRQLSATAKCTIIGDSLIECWIPLTEDKSMVPRFTFEGTMVTIDGYAATSGVTRVNFKEPRTVAVHTSEKTRYYTIVVHAYTGLPVLYITTAGNRNVTSKDYYINAHFRLVEDARTRAGGDVVEADVHIKGRGNSSWDWPKKPYRLKFDEKIAILGEHKDKSWVLIPNYADKSMLRNDFAMYLGKISNLEWTPSGHFVELFFNGKPQGTYWLCEKVKVSNHRVAVGDDGFLLEVDGWAERDKLPSFFHTGHITHAVVVKEPDSNSGDANWTYAYNYLRTVESVLFSSNFRDPSTGWQQYLDMDSFVDWYLIHEMTKNGDCMFNFSTYMNMTRGGKLKMGPIWDFDAAFGNNNEDTYAGKAFRETTGWLLEWSEWYTRLMKDPVFVAKLKERFYFFYNRKNDMLNYINADAQYLHYAVNANNDKWGTLNNATPKNSSIWGSYLNEVQYVKTFLNARLEWMKSQIDRM